MDRYKELDDLLDSIDASVFSGDMLYDEKCVVLLEEYMGRRQRAIKDHRELIKDIETNLGIA